MTSEEMLIIWRLRSELNLLKSRLRLSHEVFIQTSNIDRAAGARSETGEPERAVIRLSELNRQIKNKYAELETAKFKLFEFFQSLGLNEIDERILIERYILCAKCDLIADKVGLTRQSVSWRHREALKAIGLDAKTIANSIKKIKEATS